jgi:UDP-N-acetylmuramoyl-L-alanyl-D-glutamate--2,6-diaminopimelate ligase
MRLGDLFGSDDRIDPQAEAVVVEGLAVDSRIVKPGDLFFALAGHNTDGARFIDSAIGAGAVAVAGDHPPQGMLGVPFVTTPNPRRALALAAAKFYPRQPATIAAVTGTSGKTSVAAFTRQIWLRLGHASASIGTIGLVSPKRTIYGSLTTPDPIALHELLDRLAGSGVTNLAIEASSHGLDQKRLDGVRLAAGAFTNLTRDHMDYHPTVEEYLAVKLRLFHDLLPDGAPAVIDADSAIAPRVIAAARARGLRAVTVGVKGETIHLISVARDGMSSALDLQFGGRSFRVNFPLAGDFQISNALVAAGLCIATGSEADAVFEALKTLEGAPGRLERIGDIRGATVFVDYAHKPDALEKAIAALRPFLRRRLVLVFGCGGDRDPGKRSIMGEIAARCADVAIVTDDNPRSENPAAIRAQILGAAPSAIEIGDRAAAIREGVAMLRDGDAFLIAGKGHETGQIVGDKTLPFSDADEARAALKETA